MVLNNTKREALKENEIMKKQIDGLHGQIMNLPLAPEFAASYKGAGYLELAYKEGHRDARHAAAELVVGIKAGKEEE